MGNTLGIDLTNKKIILSEKYYKGAEIDREFFCESGFGCKSFTNGKAIFGYFTKDKEKCRISGYEVEKLS
ncbi:hypothetical protein LCGC14_1412270 [marine sediment metagenome]|uniref:Uncharacterized protein n=1 Tax=marine sediment metagenome TaxID=412755 RepID=A0A0F9JUA1_9ZZZZ